MSTSLHAICNLIFGNIYLFIVFFNIHGRKMRFSEKIQISICEKSIFGQFEVNFSTCIFFPQAGWLFSLNTLKEEYFNENMSSLAGLKKSYSFFR